MNDLQAPLRDNVRLLGQLLGETIRHNLGDDFLEKIEHIRQSSKAARSGEGSQQELLNALEDLNESELVPIARSFSQFLNLANLAEEYHHVRCRRSGTVDDPDPLSLRQGLADILDAGITPDALADKAAELDIELVLTAHPTEINRRTLIQKYESMAECLSEMDAVSPQSAPGIDLQEHLQQLISDAWYTQEIREQRPSPVDEARWGFAVIENSLWSAVPSFLRNFERELMRVSGRRLPLTSAPIRFASWMGGDRDGNPNVTAEVTDEVLMLSRWMAADLFLNDITQLRHDLSMGEASEELREVVGECAEPYRELLRQVRRRLQATRDWCQECLDNGWQDPMDAYVNDDDLRDPLLLCDRSLRESGMSDIADGRLRDTLRRIACFGLCLVRLDIRQNADRHTEVFDEITELYELGRYSEWSESKKQEFLLTELQNKRPLLPKKWQPSDNTREVLDTCQVIARQQPQALGSYVISMASRPSDVLATALLLQESGVSHPMRIVPLFETLADLDGAPDCVEQLFNIDWYHNYVDGHQEVMIGYSDSSKDAGALAAAWGQYRAQEALTQVCEKHKVRITFFHGRGGTVGRGGAPVHTAIVSQPPGSIDGNMRVTEQGEMIRFKFGMPEIAVRSLELYASSVLEVSLTPPKKPTPEWRELVDQMAGQAHEEYRSIIWDEPHFVPLFRQLTPEQELSKLPLGSRPAKRRSDGGVESLRAIPWIFAWTQTRLMLPAWLGSDKALQQVLDSDQHSVLQQMQKEWPFFTAYIEMLEMVLAKAEPQIVKYYQQTLVDAEYHSLGDRLRDRLADAKAMMLKLKNAKCLLEDNDSIRQSIEVRNPYIDPLHYLQAELLKRDRKSPDPVVEMALMVTMAGIAAGMRNTG